jgi:hypothetical protein
MHTHTRMLLGRPTAVGTSAGKISLQGPMTFQRTQRRSTGR